MLWMYNVNAGYSGLMMLEDFYYVTYNTFQTTFAMGFIMIWDQDIGLAKAAQFIKGKPADYKTETKSVGFRLTHYYRFSKGFNIQPIFGRCLWWEAYSFVAGSILYFVPFAAYGLGMANIDGKTEDLYTCGLVSIIGNILIHHIQMMITVRHWTWPLVAGVSFSLAWIPLTMIIIDYGVGFPLYRRHFTDVYG